MREMMIDGVQYGPLGQLLGRWVGTRGFDKAPEPDGIERSAFVDELTFVPAGPAKNADEQELVAVRYHHLVRRKENGLIFHDQIGHWIYEEKTGLVMHSLTIPRGVCLLAGGEVTWSGDKATFHVKAESGSDTFGVLESPFMKEKAKTKGFEMTLSVEGNQLEYRETTYLHIYGNDFDHVDKSVMQRVTYEVE